MGRPSAPDLGDPYTREILEMVQRDGRISVQAIADRLALSTAPCWRRLHELEESGIIRRYVALVDRHRVGLGSCMFTQVSLESHCERVVEAFERAMQAAPEVLECWVITGGVDYLLKIYVPDPLAFDRFLHRVLLKLEAVGHLSTLVALREVKNETRLELAQCAGTGEGERAGK
jgi:Lrp/AsnC family transcriptional regulator, leucine-responsive regulatory protein